MTIEAWTRAQWSERFQGRTWSASNSLIRGAGIVKNSHQLDRLAAPTVHQKMTWCFDARPARSLATEPKMICPNALDHHFRYFSWTGAQRFFVTACGPFAEFINASLQDGRQIPEGCCAGKMNCQPPGFIHGPWPRLVFPLLSGAPDRSGCRFPRRNAGSRNHRCRCHLNRL